MSSEIRPFGRRCKPMCGLLAAMIIESRYGTGSYGSALNGSVSAKAQSSETVEMFDPSLGGDGSGGESLDCRVSKP